MDSRIREYVDEVLSHVVAEEKLKKRIEGDLYAHIGAACETESVDTVIGRMGDPGEVAREFMDTLYESKSDVIDKLIEERIRNRQILKGYYEYKSKTRILGLPLVHIKLSRGRYWRKPVVAKGIIAIGDIAVGGLSIGGISIGGIGIGGIAMGGICFGGFSAGLLAAGGVAIGALLALGGVAVGLGAMGGVAVGKIAVGGLAVGHVAVGGKAIGEHIISTGPETTLNTALTSKEEVYHLIKSAYPGLSNWIIKIFTAIFP